MSNFSWQRLSAAHGINWVQILVVAVAANLLGGLVFTLIEGLVPSWVVIHLPFTVLVGWRGDQCADCPPTLLWVTLFIIPLLTVFVAIMAWQQARRNESKKA